MFAGSALPYTCMLGQQMHARGGVCGDRDDDDGDAAGGDAARGELRMCVWACSVGDGGTQMEKVMRERDALTHTAWAHGSSLELVRVHV